MFIFKVCVVFQQFAKLRQSNLTESPKAQVHPVLKDLIVIPSVGPIENIERRPIEIYVNDKCAQSVMRGAHVFSCGILGSNKSTDT